MTDVFFVNIVTLRLLCELHSYPWDISGYTTENHCMSYMLCNCHLQNLQASKAHKCSFADNMNVIFVQKPVKIMFTLVSPKSITSAQRVACLQFIVLSDRT